MKKVIAILAIVFIVSSLFCMAVSASETDEPSPEEPDLHTEQEAEISSEVETGGNAVTGEVIPVPEYLMGIFGDNKDTILSGASAVITAILSLCYAKGVKPDVKRIKSGVTEWKDTAQKSMDALQSDLLARIDAIENASKTSADAMKAIQAYFLTEKTADEKTALLIAALDEQSAMLNAVIQNSGVTPYLKEQAKKLHDEYKDKLTALETPKGGDGNDPEV